jgi:hypothetical protein
VGEINGTIVRRLAAAALIVLAMLPAALSAPNHTRGNNQYDVCVYFYQYNETASAHCYVPAEYCVVDDLMPNTEWEVPTTDCWKGYSTANATVTFTLAQPNRAPLFKRPA